MFVPGSMSFSFLIFGIGSVVAVIVVAALVKINLRKNA